MSKYKEKKRARMIFKRLKAGITKPEDLTAEEIRLLRKYYPFLFY
jgi:uncharacterized coiled-coil DUF342 family protein